MANWQNRIVGEGHEDPEQLLANPFNFRVHPKFQQDALGDVLDRVGWVDRVIVNRVSGHLIDGHLRVTLALRKGEPQIPVQYVDLSEDEEKLILATFDPLTALATHDAEVLANLLQDVNTDSPVLQQLLSDVAEAAGMLLSPDDTTPDPGAQVDRAAELQAIWNVARGDVWEVGTHRIMCGDSTNAEDVARLMGGQRAQGVFTSPPYAEQRKQQYGGIPADEYVTWWEGVQSNVRQWLKEDGSFFVNIKPHCEDGERVLYVFDLVLAMRRQWEWMFIDEFCWRRASLPIQPVNRFKNYFEPVYHFSLSDDMKFNPDNVKADRIYDNPKPSLKKKSGTGSGFNQHPGGFASDGAYPSNVLDIWNGEPGGEHAARFPVSLPEFFINAYSDDTDIWYDPFLGSGTTIVAAHQTGRRGFGMEISEAYVSVCLQRLTDMGLEARKQ